MFYNFCYAKVLFSEILANIYPKKMLPYDTTVVKTVRDDLKMGMKCRIEDVEDTTDTTYSLSGVDD